VPCRIKCRQIWTGFNSFRGITRSSTIVDLHQIEFRISPATSLTSLIRFCCDAFSLSYEILFLSVNHNQSLSLHDGHLTFIHALIHRSHDPRRAAGLKEREKESVGERRKGSGIMIVSDNRQGRECGRTGARERENGNVREPERWGGGRASG
jgi:hypothetical protein